MDRKLMQQMKPEMKMNRKLNEVDEDEQKVKVDEYGQKANEVE